MIWIVTVVVGLALRSLVFDRGIAPTFIVVALLTLGVLLVGWRAPGRAPAAAPRAPRGGRRMSIDPSIPDPGMLVCAICGERIKPGRTPGTYVHTTRLVAACDLDSDHTAEPAPPR